MKSTHINHEVIPTQDGTVTVSHVQVSVGFGATVYHEVAVIDTRPLDLRKHRWNVVETYIEQDRAGVVFRDTVAAVLRGEKIVGMNELLTV